MIARVLISIVALFVSLIFLVTGNGMLGTLLAVRMELEGFGSSIAGLVMSLFSVGFVLGSLYGIQVIRRVGHIRAFTTFGATATAAILIHPLFISIPVWMLLRLVVGFCIAGLMLVVESWVNARATSGTRGTLLAVYMVLFYLAAAGGQFLLGTGDPAQHHLFSLVAVLVALSLVPLSLSRAAAPDLHEGDRLGLRELLRLQALGVWTAFLSGVIAAAFAAVGPMYAVRVGLDTTQISTFMGVAILASMVCQYPIGLMSDYLPRRLVILGVAATGLAASVAVVLFAGTSTAALYGTVAVFVGTTSSLYALSLALTHDSLDHTQIVPASATLLLLFGLGTVMGPIAGATTMSLVGPPGLFGFTAGVLVTLILIEMVLLTQQKAPPVEEQAHCVNVAPVTTPVLMEIDPRNEDFEPVAEELQAQEEELDPIELENRELEESTDSRRE